MNRTAVAGARKFCQIKITKPQGMPTIPYLSGKQGAYSTLFASSPRKARKRFLSMAFM